MADREFSAGGIVIKKEKGYLRVLLIKDSYDHWTWPKGNIDKDETAHQAAVREIEEETGLDAIELIEEVGRSQYFYRLKGRLIFKTVYIFLFKLLQNQRLKVQKKEIEDARWFSPEEALEKIDYKGAEKILKKAISLFKKL